MSNQHWHHWVWKCRWCGSTIPDFDLYYQKNKRKDFCSCWCLRDFRNFIERINGKTMLKSIAEPRNSIVIEFLKIIPYFMIIRYPMMYLSEHLKLIIRLEEGKAQVSMKVMAVCLSKTPC